jgi:hypothetical protein
MQRTKWTERKFTFDAPEGWMPNILERLRGTPPRMVEICKNLSREQLTTRLDGKWSIQENIGHLLDLEELHEGRIDDFLARKNTLRAADMNNAKTVAADHNAANINDLLQNFKVARDRFVARLESLDDDILLSKSLHPRLQMPMRPVDMAFFTAEHDDNHLANIRQILVRFG